MPAIDARLHDTRWRINASSWSIRIGRCRHLRAASEARGAWRCAPASFRRRDPGSAPRRLATWLQALPAFAVRNVGGLLLPAIAFEMSLSVQEEAQRGACAQRYRAFPLAIQPGAGRADTSRYWPVRVALADWLALAVVAVSAAARRFILAGRIRPLQHDRHIALYRDIHAAAPVVDGSGTRRHASCHYQQRSGLRNRRLSQSVVSGDLSARRTSGLRHEPDAR